MKWTKYVHLTHGQDHNLDQTKWMQNSCVYLCQKLHQTSLNKMTNFKMALRSTSTMGEKLFA